MTTEQKLREVMTNEQRRNRAIRKLLDNLPWPEGLEAKTYSRLHDDHDGEETGRLVVSISHDGDTWVTTTRGSLRFRTATGGGCSVRVRNALVLLALAIQIENEEDGCRE